MAKKKKVIYVIIFSLFLILGISSMVSAGFFDWFNKITGRATSQPANVSISVAGMNITTVKVYNSTLPSVTVTNDGIGSMLFYVVVDDVDGASDINTTSVSANFTKTGEPLRANSSCVKVGVDLNASAQNYSCTIEMWYFDLQGVWNITAKATDLGNTTFTQDTSATFGLPQLQGVEIAPGSLTFPSVSPGAKNQTSNNDPTIINNTGNYLSNITINAIDLHGATVPATFIDVGNLSAANDTGSSVECGPPAKASVLTNGTDIQIINSNLTRGNHSANNYQTGQEQIYYCFQTIPSTISSQTYSSPAGHSWTIKIS